ncbi:AMP-binding protein [Albibacillus kandeliae]|uniref:AMP-binding protein n=1 Tax=Albibacillus kandeliae TaxID=2174228 RepID=UPI000D69EA60|nr:AMP-binding protein [Albibacillus kandeliae]
MNLSHWLHRQAGRDPGRPALYLGRELVADYGTFAARVSALAEWLRREGVGPGDRVGLFLQNCPEYLVIFYGILHAGAVAVPINAKLHGREAGYILGDAGAALVFTSGKEADVLAEADAPGRRVDVNGPEFAAAVSGPAGSDPVDRNRDALAWLFYTSGTTGRPKGVMITHGMLMTMSLAYLADVDAATGEDTALYAAPMSHGAGIYNIVHVLVGARHVCPPSGGFDPAEIFDLARHFGRVHMFAAPTMVKRMTGAAKAAGVRGEGLRTVVYGGGPMYLADIEEAVAHFGPVFVQIYGQGECPMGISALSRAEVADRSHPNWRERLASVGRAQSPVEIRIGDAEGQALPAGEIGEIMVRGDVVMPGYWRNEAATAKTLVDGWLMTGDMGLMDADGYVTMRDRSKDMIISGGSNVYPREVEEVLLTHPGVREVSVVGRPHADWGEEVVAFVVGEAATGELDRLCLDNIARFKRPKDYVFVPELPKNNYGKVLKTELRKQLSEGMLSETPG